MNFFMKTENLVESDFVQFDISYDNIRVTKKFLIPKFDCTTFLLAYFFFYSISRSSKHFLTISIETGKIPSLYINIKGQVKSLELRYWLEYSGLW